MRTLSYHVQNHNSDAIAHANECNPWAAKIINPPVVNPFNSCIKVFARHWIGGDHEERYYIRRGSKGAKDYFAHLARRYEQSRYCHAHEGPNEPGVGDIDSIKWLLEFTDSWTGLMHSAEFKTVGFNFSVGWPKLEDVPMFGQVARRCDYVGAHEYGAPRMPDDRGWHCLRYRATLLHLGVPIIIGECGIDGGVAPVHKPQHGWKHFASVDEYWWQLLWYEQELAKTPEVKAAFIFTSGPESQWTSFGVEGEISRRLRDHWLTGKTVEDQIRRAREAHVFPVNPDAALARYIDNQGWSIQGDEFYVGGFVCQAAYVSLDRQVVVFAPVGRWNDIKVLEV